MIQMLRKETLSGPIDDLAHVTTDACFADSLTTTSASPEVLANAVETWILPRSDLNPSVRATVDHTACHTDAGRGFWRVTDSCLVRMHVCPRKASYVPDSRRHTRDDIEGATSTNLFHAKS